ncbi:glycoside hydrolase family 95 protein [Ruminococcus sp.]|uniref:glycoside hydrolase family 95 protein n=1 Tax=Ruminococcus sp. TaxID=41978 RepID=UPI0025D0545A|nr:glycoside hydrolase family 95 protein [Ruminococcus sp.]MBQ9541918.1 glycoside hydrolase family 95 protein [Ruminococcus sp.]
MAVLMMNDRKIWFKAPAEDWNVALPVGNGRIGGMCFGQPLYEKIQLNEDSIFSGGQRKRNNPSARENLEKVRQLLKEEKIAEAEKIVLEAFCGTPVNQRHYMPLGDLVIQHHLESECEYKCRSLDLENAVCTAEYSIKGVNYVRRVICSEPAQVMAINITADKSASISLKLTLDGRDDYFDDNSPVNDTDILYYGGCGGEDGINFAAYLRVIGVGGSVHRWGSSIVTEDCDSVTILIGVQTSYRVSDYKKSAELDVITAAEKDFEELLKEHIEDYRSYFDRTEIVFDEGGNDSLPTDERLKLVKEGGVDNGLVSLYFDFGRYLMISGSREGTLPLNLQGIWNKDMWPAWGCRFTVNINTEMNYWLAEVADMGDLHMPLFDHIERMRPNGRATAREMYGCGGFVCHHNTDIWGDTAPQDLWMPGTQWVTGAAWLCTHIWEHWLYSRDREFLAEKYDTLKEASLFFVDFLIDNGKGQLVTCPSVSPENTYITASGAKGSVCMGPSMDSQIIYELFTAVIEAGEVLGIDAEYREKLKGMRDKLPKPQIGKYGQIMEWAEDYDEAEPGHRHISQLFALYPADIISYRKTPELAAAARATIERRLAHGGGHTGWSRAWIINHWARLHDGVKVKENIAALLENSTSDNLFDMHPPFQIDGNFGAAAGIAESLLQSECGEIELLPALSPDWKNGHFRGLRARGGFAVDCDWADGKPVKCVIKSLKGEKCRLVIPVGCEIKNASAEYVTSGDCIELNMNAGESAEIVFA